MTPLACCMDLSGVMAQPFNNPINRSIAKHLCSRHPKLNRVGVKKFFTACGDYAVIKVGRDERLL